MFLALFIIHRHMLAIIFGFYSSVVYQRCITKTLPLFTRRLHCSQCHMNTFLALAFKKYQKNENERVLEVWLFNLKYMTKISQIIWLLWNWLSAIMLHKNSSLGRKVQLGP